MKCIVECITIDGKIVEKRLTRVSGADAERMVGLTETKGSVFRYTNKARWKALKNTKKRKSKAVVKPELCRESEKKRFVHGT